MMLISSVTMIADIVGENAHVIHASRLLFPAILSEYLNVEAQNWIAKWLDTSHESCTA